MARIATIGYFKAFKSRNGGKVQGMVYFAVRIDGSIISIDFTRSKKAYLKSFGSTPIALQNSTAKEFEKANNDFNNKL